MDIKVEEATSLATSTSYVDHSGLLADLVRQYSVESTVSPVERRTLWKEIAKDYNRARGTDFEYNRIAKRWHNMKQAARQRFMLMKRKAARQNSTKKRPQSNWHEMEPFSDQDDELVVVPSLTKDTTDQPPYIRDQLDTAVIIQESNQEAAFVKTKEGQDKLLRDLLICLAHKYNVESSRMKLPFKSQVWSELAREYHLVSGGILNASKKQLLTKWNNLKFNAKQKRDPPPISMADHLDLDDIVAKLKLAKVNLSVYNQANELRHEVEKEMDRDFAFQAVVKGRQLDKHLDPLKPPSPSSVKKRRLKDKSVTCKVAASPLPDTGSSLRSLERQIYTETLRYEQEKLRLLQETAKLEHEKLHKDIELTDVQLQKAKIELEREKRRLK